MLLSCKITLKYFIDKNECATNTHNCVSDEYCMNTEGSFVCRCPDGYSLADDGHSCNGKQVFPLSLKVFN